MLVLDGGTLIDGVQDAPVKEAVVVIAGDTIAQVGRRGAVAFPTGARRIDTTGKTILPGLIDAHVHDLGDWALGAYLAYGVTSVKDAGSVLDRTLAQKRQIEAGEKRGPRIFVIGPIVDGPPASYPELSLEVHGPQDAREKVRRLLERHSLDGVLVGQRIDAQALRAIVAVGREHEVHVSGQTWLSSGREAVAAGIHALENTSRLPALAPPDVDSPRQFDAPLDIAARIARLATLWNGADESLLSDLLDSMVRQQVFWVPTLVVFRQLAGLQDPALPERAELARVPPRYLQRWADEPRYKSWQAEQFRQLRSASAQIQAFTRRFEAAGGLVVAGTDTPNPYVVPGLSLHQELELLVAAGVPALRAIRSATSNAAKFLGKRAAKLGSVEVGNLADLVVVDGDPLQDIRATRHISHVIRDGVLLDRNEVL